jgi:hypothetical protein
LRNVRKDFAPPRSTSPPVGDKAISNCNPRERLLRLLMFERTPGHRTPTDIMLPFLFRRLGQSLLVIAAMATLVFARPHRRRHSRAERRNGEVPRAPAR